MGIGGLNSAEANMASAAQRRTGEVTRAGGELSGQINVSRTNEAQFSPQAISSALGLDSNMKIEQFQHNEKKLQAELKKAVEDMDSPAKRVMGVPSGDSPMSPFSGAAATLEALRRNKGNISV